MTWFVARLIARPLQSLTRQADAIRRFEFAQPFEVQSNISEVNELGVKMDGMKRTIRRFLDVIQAVAAEPSFKRLLPMLLMETLDAADADSGVLYLVDGDTLDPGAALDQDRSDVTASLETSTLADALPLVQEVIRGKSASAGRLTRDDINEANLNALSRSDDRHAAAVPLLNRQRQLVGVVLPLHATTIDDAQLSFAKALAGLAANALEARELIKAQRDLFEAFIPVIAGAIDAKSPYSGGHCARVPELTKMLAKAACEADSGPYQAFQLNEQEWEALRVAAWLHDCGKVTTPEYVVDKATKLESIFDRIHEIRVRFEVLKRDADISCLRAVAAGEDIASAQARRDADLSKLDDLFLISGAYLDYAERIMSPQQIDEVDVERYVRSKGAKVESGGAATSG